MNGTSTTRIATRERMARIARLAPFFALGPISGPFTAGIVLNFRGGRPVLGSLYAVALVLWLVLAPLEAIRLLHHHI